MRKILAMLFAIVATALPGGSAHAEQFSIKCTFLGGYFVTFDTSDSRVVYDMPKALALRGHIDQSSEDGFRFHLLMVGEPRFDLAWNKRSQTLTWIGIPGNATRGTHKHQCEPAQLRLIINDYDKIAPLN